MSLVSNVPPMARTMPLGQTTKEHGSLWKFRPKHDQESRHGMGSLIVYE